MSAGTSLDTHVARVAGGPYVKWGNGTVIEGQQSMLRSLGGIRTAQFRVPSCCRAYVMDAIPGRPLDEAIDDLEPDTCADRMARIISEIAARQPTAEPAMLPAGRLLEAFRKASEVTGFCLPELAHCIGFMPVGRCHGDLALDNVLVTRDFEYWLIDPILQDVQTPLWDVAKVMQSCTCGWRGIRDTGVPSRSPAMRQFAERFEAWAVERYGVRQCQAFLAAVCARVSRHRAADVLMPMAATLISRINNGDPSLALLEGEA